MASPSEPAYENACSASEDIHSLSCDAKQSHPHREPIRVVAERKSLRWRMPKASFKKGERVREDETENVRERKQSSRRARWLSLPCPFLHPLSQCHLVLRLEAGDRQTSPWPTLATAELCTLTSRKSIPSLGLSTHSTPLAITIRPLPFQTIGQEWQHVPRKSSTDCPTTTPNLPVQVYI